MPQALYRKWRSQTFDEVVGQQHVTQTLQNALREDRVAHAYLFSGPRGTGKTSTARILAKALNCTAAEGEIPCNQCPTCVAINEGRMIDLIEIDAASNRGIDDIRELREKVGFRPSEGRVKVYIIDEVHMLTDQAFNALLKTLEEPPPYVRFVLATTEPHKLPQTVISRCQRFDFRRIPTQEIADHLRYILDTEGYAAEDAALIAIARSAEGCMRDAISLLDQMLSYGTQSVTLEQVQQVLGAVSSQVVWRFVDAVAEKDAGAGLQLIQQLALDGSSLTEFTAQVIGYLRGVMLFQMAGDLELLSEWPQDVVQNMTQQAQKLDRSATVYAVKRFGETATALRGGYQPQLPLELALIDVIRWEPSPVVQEVVVTQTAATASAAQQVKPVTTTPKPTTKRTASPSSAPEAKTSPDGDEAAELAPLDENAVRTLQKQWNNFLNKIRGVCGYEVQAALRPVRDIAVANNSVAFAFGNNDFSRRMVEKPETLKVVADVLSEILGRPIHLECQMGEKAQLRNTVGLSGAANSDKSSDELIDYVVNELGAEIVERSD